MRRQRRQRIRAALDEQERAVVMGARIIRRLWRDNNTASVEQLASLIAAALLLAGWDDLAKRIKP